MANNVKKVWASGKAVVNAWLAIPSGFSAEVIAQCGFDSVTVDMQHGVQDYLSMVQCFQARAIANGQHPGSRLKRPHAPSRTDPGRWRTPDAAGS
jgi:2-keto-3-deoxy-L-rhamnonate aldolase RhmA